MTTQQTLDERYGRSSGRRPVVWIVVGIVAVVIVGYFGWTTVTRNLNTVDADSTAFAIPDAHSVQVTFQVTAPTGRSIACAVEARDTEHGTVGWRVVEYPGSPDHTRAFTESVPTLALATTGLINGCWVT